MSGITRQDPAQPPPNLDAEAVEEADTNGSRARNIAAARRLQRLLDAARTINIRARPIPDPGLDPVKVEAELYDALYGHRTGTVENVAPVDGVVPLARGQRAS
jgi:hypothetical protein